MNTKATILILVLLLLGVPVASAENYANLSIESVVVSNGQYTWSATPISIDLNTPKTVGDFTFNLDSATPLTATILVQGGMIPFFTISKGTNTVCLKGNGSDICPDTPTNISLGEVRLRLVRTGTYSESDTTTFTNSTSSSDNPVYAYVYYDRELPMAKGKINNFNGEEYVKQTGWATEGGVSEVNVYFKRKDTSIPMSISVKAESTEPKVVWSDKTAKYTIDSNGKYEFTIKYETKNVWGWKEEFTEVYTLITTGMSSSSSGTKAITSEAPYEANVGSEFILTMSTTGKFDAQPDVEIIDAGNRKYGITFGKPGTYDMNFKSTDGGSAIVKFAVKPAASTTASSSTSTTTTTANQQQPQEGDDGSLIWYIILLVAAGGLGYMIISRKKKSTSYHLHPKPQ